MPFITRNPGEGEWTTADGESPEMIRRDPRSLPNPSKPKEKVADPLDGLSARAEFARQRGEVFEQPSATPEPKPEDKKEKEVDPRPINYNPTYVTGRQEPDTRFLRVQLPSNFVFYHFNDFQMRPFGVRDLAKLARAKEEKNPTVFIDVIDGVVTEDIRTLTVGDFYYLLYLLRIWSYPKTPFTVTWTSQYGNTNKYNITTSNLETKTLELPRDKYQEWYDRGYCVPTVRDMEVFASEHLDSEFKWQFERAQYIRGDTVMDKIDNLDRMGIEALENIREFQKVLEHGVVETITLRDPLFNPHDYLKRLKEELARVELTGYKGSDEKFGNVSALRNEIRNIEVQLASGKTVEAEPQTIRVSVNLLTFFPDI